jgi:DNA-binding MarR family transcriptional regulator
MEESPHRKRTAGLRRPSVLGWLHLLRISHQVLQSAATQLSVWSLSNAQFDVLSQVGAAEGISQFGLAKRLFVTQGNITQLLDKMEARGLIRRIPEGRTKRLYLTPAGRQLFAEVVPVHQDFISAQLSTLTIEEQRQLLRLLAKLDRAQRSQKTK